MTSAKRYLPALVCPRTVNRILTFGFSSLNQWPSDAGLFNFLRPDTVTGDVVNPIFRPNEFENPHAGNSIISMPSAGASPQYLSGL